MVPSVRPRSMAGPSNRHEAASVPSGRTLTRRARAPPGFRPGARAAGAGAGAAATPPPVATGMLPAAAAVLGAARAGPGERALTGKTAARMPAGGVGETARVGAIASAPTGGDAEAPSRAPQ